MLRLTECRRTATHRIINPLLTVIGLTSCIAFLSRLDVVSYRSVGYMSGTHEKEGVVSQSNLRDNISLWRARVRKRNIMIDKDGVKDFGEDNNLGRVWDYFFEDWQCPFAERIGRPGDGGKWICDLGTIPKDSCIVYSVGLFDNDEFERSIHDLVPTCEIHSFDPTPGEIDKFHMDDRLAAYGANFHHYGISGHGRRINIEGVDVPTKYLAEAMAELGHTKIDILKLDIEFSEYDLIENVFCSLSDPKCKLVDNIDMLLVEMHFRTASEVVRTFQRLSEHGYGIFQKEPNPIGYPLAVEYAFVKVDRQDPRKSLNG